MSKKYIVCLTTEERRELQERVNQGKVAAYKRLHAQILLKATISEEGDGWDDVRISEAFSSIRTVEQIRQRLVEQGLEAAIKRAKQVRVRRGVLDGEPEATLVALSCSEPPDRRARWTLQGLADKMVEFKDVESGSDETVRRTLKKMNSSLGKERNGAYRLKPMRNLSARWKA